MDEQGFCFFITILDHKRMPEQVGGVSKEIIIIRYNLQNNDL